MKLWSLLYHQECIVIKHLANPPIIHSIRCKTISLSTGKKSKQKTKEYVYTRAFFFLFFFFFYFFLFFLPVVDKLAEWVPFIPHKWVKANHISNTFHYPLSDMSAMWTKGHVKKNRGTNSLTRWKLVFCVSEICEYKNKRLSM